MLRKSSLFADTYRYYCALIAIAPNAEHGLGGHLIYAGKLDDTSIPIVRAANTAGAATLVICENAAQQRTAIHDRVVDFVVTSLDEALRILKNEIRKKQTVAVCIASSPETIEREMHERGVLPDILPREMPTPNLPDGKQLFAWEIPSGITTRAEELLLTHISTENSAERRWVRLASRYMGSAERRMRSMACDPQTADQITAEIQAAS